jgi:hypothetical protein
MLEPRSRANLGEETLAAECGAKVRMKHFHGDVAVVLEIVRDVDGRHAALAQLAVYSISIGQRVSESRAQSVFLSVDAPIKWGNHKAVSLG